MILVSVFLGERNGGNQGGNLWKLGTKIIWGGLRTADAESLREGYEKPQMRTMVLEYKNLKNWVIFGANVGEKTNSSTMVRIWDQILMIFPDGTNMNKRNMSFS